MSDRTKEFIEVVERIATRLDEVPALFEYQRDPDDAHYINLALAAQAKLIVSRDLDLLDLMDRSKPEAVEFQRRFPDFRILDPVSFLNRMGISC